MKINIKKITKGIYAGEFRFEIIAANGEKIDPRQPYNTKQSVQKTIKLLKSELATAEVVDLTKQ